MQLAQFVHIALLLALHSSKQLMASGVKMCVFINCTYTLCLKKISHLMFDNNFGKCGPVFKILSPVDS